MNNDWIIANIPWIGLLIVAFVSARLVVFLSGARIELQRVRSIHQCEEGSTQAVSFVLTLPFFMMILMLIVQIGQIMIANIAVHQAAYAAVRSAAVWIPADVAGIPQVDEIEQLSIAANIDNPKYARIKQAAVLAVASQAPSRDFGYQLDPEGQQTASALSRLYAGLDSDSNSNTLSATRLRNKLAYANANTIVRVNSASIGGNSLQSQDDVTATVTFRVPLLPGPLRFLTNSGDGDAGSSGVEQVDSSAATDPLLRDMAGNCGTRPAADGCGQTDATSQAFTFSLSASATMVLERQLPVLPYQQEAF